MENLLTTIWSSLLLEEPECGLKGARDKGGATEVKNKQHAGTYQESQTLLEVAESKTFQLTILKFGFWVLFLAGKQGMTCPHTAIFGHKKQFHSFQFRLCNMQPETVAGKQNCHSITTYMGNNILWCCSSYEWIVLNSYWQNKPLWFNLSVTFVTSQPLYPNRKLIGYGMDHFWCQTCRTSEMTEPKSEWFARSRTQTHTHTNTLFYNELWWVAEDAHWGRWDVSFASTASNIRLTWELCSANQLPPSHAHHLCKVW